MDPKNMTFIFLIPLTLEPAYDKKVEIIMLDVNLSAAVKWLLRKKLQGQSQPPKKKTKHNNNNKNC